MSRREFDSIIFDMDGTLWDAVDSYKEVWIQSFRDMGLPYSVSRQQLIECMGQTIDTIYTRLVNDDECKSEFLKQLEYNEMQMMPKLGGKLYDGVREWVPRLAEEYKLLMVSNCGSDGLHNFLRFTGLTPYFTDTLTYCQTKLQKEGNIALLMRCHDLSAPIYVGDTQGDCNSAHKAGIPMLHVEWGFGTAPDADFRADSFEHLAKFFLS